MQPVGGVASGVDGEQQEGVLALGEGERPGREVGADQGRRCPVHGQLAGAAHLAGEGDLRVAGDGAIGRVDGQELGRREVDLEADREVGDVARLVGRGDCQGMDALGADRGSGSERLAVE